VVSDSEAITRIRNGRVREFDILVDRYQHSVHAFAYRILGRREDAEDATQDTFIRAFQSLDSYACNCSIWPWLRRIAVNRSLSDWRWLNKNCDQIYESLFLYADGEIGDAERLSVERHMAECSACRKHVEALVEARSRLKNP